MLNISRVVSSINVRYIYELRKFQSKSPKTSCVNRKKNSNIIKVNIRKQKKNTNGMMATQIEQGAGSTSVDTSSSTNSQESVTVVNEFPSIRYNFNPTNASNDDVYQFRGWRDVGYKGFIGERRPGVCGDGIDFKLMSYNILAQDLLEGHAYLYQNNPRNALIWDYRLERIKKEVLAIKPDILCLQEVQYDHLSAIVKSFESLNFDHVFKRKTGNRPDGCAIFFNKTLFNLQERHNIEYYQPNIEKLNRDNVAVLVKLSLASDPNTSLVVATTHLLYNPRRQDVRLAQVQVLLAELDRISMAGYTESGEQKRLPIILTGDFNLKPNTAPYKLICDGVLDYENLTKPTLYYANDDYSVRTGKIFLPPELGITDNCQHFDVVNSQYETLESRLQNLALGKSTENYTQSDPYLDKVRESQPNLFSSGRLTHNLNLTSVYKHLVNDSREATTFQERWITVDYIFYSKYTSSLETVPCEGSLKLLSEYTLPSVEQCHVMGNIPNLVLGSDHISLAAKFYLKKISQN